MKINELFENKASKQLTRAEKDAKRADKKAEVEKVGKAATDRIATDRAAKMAALYDGKPMKIKLKVWTDTDPRTTKRRFEMREFTIDNTQHVRAQLSDVELQDMRYLENAEKREATYAIKTGDQKHYTGSIPEYLFDLPKRTRKTGAPEDLRREMYKA
jgi:hypothetical protein